MKKQFSIDGNPDSFGNYFIIGLSGTELSDNDKRMLSILKPAGILLLPRNFDHKLPYQAWLAKLKKLYAQIREYAERDKMIMTLDHEGGHVCRVPEPITRFPYAEKYAKNSARVAQAMAKEIKSMGVNVSWAPVADIHSNPLNPIIGKRAFGKKPSEVIPAIIEFTIALQAEGVLGCAKHFPGHGDTATDSHLELPILNLSEKEIRERELLPFKALVEIEIPFVMTAHIIFPKIDRLYPATLSAKILNEILRKEWGYQGIVVSDDLDMLAVSQAFTKADTLAQACNAGCDMFIVSRNPSGDSIRPVAVANLMLEAVKNRQLREETLLASFNRVENLIEDRLSQHAVLELNEELLAEHQELARTLG